MDINSLLSDDAFNDTIHLKENNLKKSLYDIVSIGYIDISQYKWWLEFIRLKGSISGIAKVIDLINGLHRSDNDMDNKLDIFKKDLCQFFNHLFKPDPHFRLNRNIIYNATRVDSIEYTAEQKKGIRNMLNFVMDGKRKSYGLYGYAGTGKTTSVVELISYLLKNRLINSVALTAPTNKAVNVIKNKFKPHLKQIIETLFEKKIENNNNNNMDDGLDFLETQNISIHLFTIHKLLCFQTDYSVSGDTIFVRDAKKGSLICNYDLCIIDECSMINTDMIDCIFSEIRHSEKNIFKRLPKIIFSGDPAQLPPVNEDDSCIFYNNLTIEQYSENMNYRLSDLIVSDSQDIMANRFNVLKSDINEMKNYTLKKVCRSKLDTVTDCCLMFRKWVIDDMMPDLTKFIDANGIGFYDAKQTRDRINTDWFKLFLKKIKSNEQCIIITWTNRQTDHYNVAIRRKLFNKTQMQKFEIGDILMLSDFYNLNISDAMMTQKLYTSEQIKVNTADLTDIPLNKFPYITNSVIKKMKQSIKIQEQINLLVDGINTTLMNNTTLKAWFLGVSRLNQNDNHNLPLVVIDDHSIEQYNRIKNDTNQVIKNFCKMILTQYHQTTKLIERYVVKPLWKYWHKIIIDPFANVNYGYSITCHKAQGSNFYNVFIDLDDILQNPKKLEAKKCAYTALTRTCNELHILT